MPKVYGEMPLQDAKPADAVKGLDSLEFFELPDDAKKEDLQEALTECKTIMKAIEDRIAELETAAATSLDVETVREVEAGIDQTLSHQNPPPPADNGSGELEFVNGTDTIVAEAGASEAGPRVPSQINPQSGDDGPPSRLDFLVLETRVKTIEEYISRKQPDFSAQT